MIRIHPKTYFEGEFTLPGDKSITHRAILFNAFAEGKATVYNPLLAEDTLSTCACMRALGAKITLDGQLLCIEGTARFQNGLALNCGNSATTMRLLIGLLAGKGVEATLFGDSSLSSRPMARVATPLSLLGAKVKTTDGRPPVRITPTPLHGAKVCLEVPSAQVKSAVLLAGLNAEGETTVIEPVPTRDHTERLLSAMGANISKQGNEVTVQKSTLNAMDITVPADISSAAYFMALGALKGKTLCKGVGINPTRTGILRAFDKLGVRYTILNKRVVGGEEVADILVEKSPLRGIELTAEEIPSMIDELPVIALLCAFADGETRITGAQELRVKESNRLTATASLINALGGDCTELADGLCIRGKERLSGGDFDSGNDHRIAMTATVGMLASEQGGFLTGETCCAVSFPNFFETLGVCTK